MHRHRGPFLKPYGGLGKEVAHTMTLAVGISLRSLRRPELRSCGQLQGRGRDLARGGISDQVLRVSGI